MIELVKSFEIKLVVQGKGKRYRDIRLALGEILFNIPVLTCRIVGVEDAVFNFGKTAFCVQSDGSMSFPEQEIWINDSPVFKDIGWKLVRWLPNETLYCSGRPFLKNLGMESQIGCLYELDPVRKKVTLLMRGNPCAKVKGE